jgi:uncharacterized protein with PQ loop repeat
MEFVGWIGSVLMAFCCLPQVIKTSKTKEVNSFSTSMLWMWFFGEYAMLSYLFHNGFYKDVWVWPVIASYVLNTVAVTYLLYVKCKYKA